MGGGGIRDICQLNRRLCSLKCVAGGGGGCRRASLSIPGAYSRLLFHHALHTHPLFCKRPSRSRRRESAFPSALALAEAAKAALCPCGGSSGAGALCSLFCSSGCCYSHAPPTTAAGRAGKQARRGSFISRGKEGKQETGI